MKTKLKVLLKVVLMRSARQRLKMKIFVTVLIFWFSEYYDITTFQNGMRRAQSTGLFFSLSLSRYSRMTMKRITELPRTERRMRKEKQRLQSVASR